MAITVHELFGSRDSEIGRNAQAFTLTYMIKGSTNDQDVRDALFLALPATYGTLFLSNYNVKHQGGGVWIGEAKYSSLVPIENPAGGPDPTSPPPPPPPAPPALYDPIPTGFSFDISGVAEHITQSKQTMQKVKRGGGIPPDTQRAIGVTADGEVTGVDVLVPKFEWSVTRQFTFITINYLRILNSLVGTTNIGPFYRWGTRECLFLGASGATQNDAPLQVTFKFLTSQALFNVNICEGLTVPVIDPHEYLWISYKDVPNAGFMTMQPDAAYVERIYNGSNFALLGIG